MKLQDIIFMLILLIPAYGFAQDIAVNHSLEIILDKDPTTSKLNINQHINPPNRSSMFSGRLESDYVLMRKIVESQGGEIMLEVYDDGMNDDENVIIKLTNEGNLSEYFSLQLFNDEFILDEQYDGNTTNTVFGAYQQGDTFEIIRCDDAVIYRRNGMTLHTTSLIDDDFIMHGEVLVTESEPTPGTGTNEETIDFRAQVKFLIL